MRVNNPAITSQRLWKKYLQSPNTKDGKGFLILKEYGYNGGIVCDFIDRLFIHDRVKSIQMYYAL